jgi:hypothetical protein
MRQQGGREPDDIENQERLHGPHDTATSWPHPQAERPELRREGGTTAFGHAHRGLKAAPDVPPADPVGMVCGPAAKAAAVGDPHPAG